MRHEFTKFTTTAATTLAENLDTANERALDAIVDANRRVVDFAVTAVDRLADQITFELPFADRLPTPAESGERYLDFVERAVAVNRDFNDRIVSMLKVDAPAAATFVADFTESVATESAAGATGPSADTGTVAAREARARKAPAKKAAARKTPARKAAAKRASAGATSTRTAAKKTANSSAKPTAAK